MASQVTIERQMNKELKVFSNEKLMKIIRDMMYDHSTLYLKVDVKLEEDPFIDDEFTHVLHYNFNIIGYERADCGPRETRNISFSYYDLEDPDTKFYDSKGGSYFLDDHQLMNSHSDTYKKLLLKKYALLSFIYEYRYDIKLNEKSSDKILDQLQNVESHLFFKFFKNVNESINDPGSEDFKEFLYSFLGKSINSIQYSSHYTTLNWTTFKEEKLEPRLEPKSEAEIKKELDSKLKKLCLKPEIYKDIDLKLKALGLKLEEPEPEKETDFRDPKKNS